MAKIFTPKKYELKEIGKLLEKSHPSTHAHIKAQELAKTILPTKFNHKGYDIEILEPPIEENGLLKVSVKAFLNGKELFVDNPLLYKNPPIMVPDGTWHKGVDKDGNEVDYPNFTEDLSTSLKEIIVQTVEVLNRWVQ